MNPHRLNRSGKLAVCWRDAEPLDLVRDASLLGLIAIWEQRGDNWHSRPGESAFLDRLVSEDSGTAEA